MNKETRFEYELNLVSFLGDIFNMDKLSEEMKTEKDFIERIEAAGAKPVVDDVEINTPHTSAVTEREIMQQEMAIKAKEENKSVAEEPTSSIVRPSFEELQPSPITNEVVADLSRAAKLTPTPETVEVKDADDDSGAPWENNDKAFENKTPVVEEVPTPEAAEVEVKEVREEEVKPEPVKKASAKEVSVISATEAAVMEETEKTTSKLGKEVIEDDMDKRVRDENIEIRKVNEARLEEDDDDDFTPDKVIETFNNNYEDSDEVVVDENKTIEIVSESDPKEKETVKKAVENAAVEREHNYYGGDGKQTSFKLRTAKVSKVLRNIKIEDTDSITATDISKKTQKEQQNIYMTTVLPTLQPSYSVVPFVVSGVVITMTAFQWVDIKEICKIDEKIDELDPSSEDYIYEKNLIFLEKREKQMEIFYRHIYSVSGYESKPSKYKLFNEIIKLPDFQQLFFAAYAATFQKPTSIGLTCATCGVTHDLQVGSKDLCFLLNKHIEYDKLNKYIDKGAISGSSTAEVYEEFQKEKIVESANKIYRIQQKLPITSFIYELQVPYVGQAYTALAEIIEKFRDKPLEYVDEETQQMVSIDSTFGLPAYLIELRKYLYLKSLLVPHIVDEDSSSAKVSYINFTDLDGIIDSVYNLAPEDYTALMNDPRLNSIMNISGIRHLIDGKQCPEPSCGAELGLLPVEPETLFFMIARQN